MRAREYTDPKPPPDPQLGEVWAYGRPVEWGWTCFSCDKTGDGCVDAQTAMAVLDKHVVVCLSVYLDDGA